jgi:hypothetical protein
MATYNTLDALVHIWSPRFVPFLDEEQWEPYDGPKYVADKAMMWKKRVLEGTLVTPWKDQM